MTAVPSYPRTDIEKILLWRLRRKSNGRVTLDASRGEGRGKRGCFSGSFIANNFWSFRAVQRVAKIKTLLTCLEFSELPVRQSVTQIIGLQTQTKSNTPALANPSIPNKKMKNTDFFVAKVLIRKSSMIPLTTSNSLESFINEDFKHRYCVGHSEHDGIFIPLIRSEPVSQWRNVLLN